ncbi:hypothetical protein OK016_02565 [Vibrio chagasii]|nr:hypothetical protein [Vibrio chagasii]
MRSTKGWIKFWREASAKVVFMMRRRDFNGQMLKQSTRRGEIEIAAFVTKRMQSASSVYSIPFQGIKQVNRLTTTATDPHAKIPEFKVAAVRIDPFEILHQLSRGLAQSVK